MDQMSALQRALDRVSAAAESYGVLPASVDATTSEQLTVAPQWRTGWTAGRLQRIFAELAERHREECDRDDCGTCAGIADGLTVSLASLRNTQREQMEQWLRDGDTPPRPARYQARNRRLDV